jgi:hypothetical protein
MKKREVLKQHNSFHTYSSVGVISNEIQKNIDCRHDENKELKEVPPVVQVDQNSVSYN